MRGIHQSDWIHHTRSRYWWSKKQCKYYLDISHKNQMTLCAMFCCLDQLKDLWILWIWIHSHSAEQLKVCSTFDIDIKKKCHSHSYDNTSNRIGKYSGFQAWIKILNEFANYSSCFVYSQNLVGKCAAEHCQEVFIFYSHFFLLVFTGGVSFLQHYLMVALICLLGKEYQISCSHFLQIKGNHIYTGFLQ